MSCCSHLESEGAVGGVSEDDGHVTGSDDEEEEEVPIDEDLFATEDLEDLDLEDLNLEPSDSND